MIVSVAYNDCGGKLTGSGGEIMSPNYPGIYPNHSVCVWTIQGATGFPIRISFADFDMEDSNSCQQDALEVVFHFASLNTFMIS